MSDRRRIIGAFAHISFAFVLACCASSRAQAQSQDYQPVWKTKFSQPIDWYGRTSGGLLIVRAGKTLTAVDGDTGKQLWTIPYVENADARFTNVYEVPGIPILLIARAKLSAGDSEHFLGVDLSTGEIKWQAPSFDDPIKIFPLFKSNRVLLLVNEARVSNKPMLMLLDPLSGLTDWETSDLDKKFLIAGLLQFTEWNGQGYLYNSLPYDPPAIGRIDLKSGQELWSFHESRWQSQPRAGTLFLGFPSPQFAGGLVIFAANDIFGLDPASGRVVWKTKDLGKIREIWEQEGTILGTGDKGAYALDPTTGAVKWHLDATGRETDFLYHLKKKMLLFCDRSDLVEVDAATGKTIRRTPHHLDAVPRFIATEGEKRILVEGDEKAVLLNEDTGELVETLPTPDLARGAVSFLMPELPVDFIETVQKDILQPQNNGQPPAEPWLAHLESLAGVDSMLFVKNTGQAKDDYDYWLVNGKTGAVKKFELSGTQPDVSSSLTLVYLVEQGNELWAARLPAN